MPGSETAASWIRRHGPALAFFIVAIALFLIANRGAYRGYFADDELDNLAFTNQLFASDFVEGLIEPVFYQNNFRPAGHLFFRLMGDRFGLWFPPYVGALQAIHLLNVALVWLVLRRLQLPAVACGAGAMLFAFHMATFDVYWKPMYVFDLLCGTFCLVTLLLWMADSWIAWGLGLVSMWLAFRSKEIAVMLPVAMAAYELLSGRRRWRRLIPFAAFSLWFGLQGLSHGAGLKTDYSLSFHASDLWKTVLFYASKLVTVPYEGAALIVLAAAVLAAVFFVRDWRLLFGLILFGAMIVPMLLLPGRLFGAYLYVPLIGFSVAAGCVAAGRGYAGRGLAPHGWLLGLFLMMWLSWNYVNLRAMRRAWLIEAADRRMYVAALTGLALEQPGITTFVYEDGPLAEYGANAAVRWLHPGKPIVMVSEQESKTEVLMESPILAILYWDKNTRRLNPIVRAPSIESYVQAGPAMPVWQLRDGWFPGEGLHRWTKPHAVAELMRPARAASFEITVNVNEEYIAKLHESHVRLALGGAQIGGFDLTAPGLQTYRLPVPPAPSGRVELTIDVDPPYPGNEPLGIAVAGFGFPPAHSMK